MDAPNNDDHREAAVGLAVEAWRFANVCARITNKLDASVGTRFESQLRYFLRQTEEKLAEARLKVVDLQGQTYEEGMAVSALNLADFGPDDRLYVERMLEPLIMGPEGVVRIGTVKLAKLEN